MEKVKVKIYSETGVIPEYKTTGSAGFDLMANVKEDNKIYLSKEDVQAIVTGCKLISKEGQIGVNFEKEADIAISNFIKSAYNGSVLNIDPRYIGSSLAYAIIDRYEDTDNVIPEEGIYVVPPYYSGIISTGIRMEIPVGYELQIRPRSGINAKTLISVKLGTVDSDYRGDIGIIVQNKSNVSFIIEHGDRLAQGVLSKVPQADFEIVNTVEELSSTERGEGGFGSTGK